MPKNVREVLHEGGNVAAAGQGKGRGARNKDGEGRGGSTRRARVPGEGRSAACRRRQKAKSIILYKPVVNCSMPHRSLNTARMEAEAEGAARAEREARRRPKRRPGRVYTREAFLAKFLWRSLLCKIAGRRRLAIEIEEGRGKREGIGEGLYHG